MDTRFIFRPSPALCVVMALAALAAHRDVQALTFLVGGDGACDYNTIQAAINGAASNPGPDGIHIANNAAYSQQALTIGTQDLIVEGGYARCGSATPTVANTIVNGAGGAAAPVLRISGSGVRDLRNLTIRGGDSTGTNYGGGIQFSGSGDLILRNDGISNNTSAYGGGIFFNGSGGPAVLTIETNTVILNNTAQNSGGGIYISGSARLFMLRDRTTIQGNTAVSGNGGGIAVVGPALADIASPGFGNNGALFNNQAVRGGGIAVIAGSDSDADANVRLFGVDANRPVRIHGNVAIERGGAIWMAPYNTLLGATNYVATCASDFLIDGNRAPEGSAVYGQYEQPFQILADSMFELNSDAQSNTGFCPNLFPETAESLGRVACATGVNSCNFIANNFAANTAGVQTSGATIYMQKGGDLNLYDSVFIGNIGGNVIHGDGSTFYIIRNNLIVSNSLSSDVIQGTGSGPGNVKLIDNTIAGNVVGGATHVLRFDYEVFFNIRNNIIWQPGKLTLLYPGGGQNLDSEDVRYNVVSDVTTLPQGPYNLQRDPQFIDPELSNFGLRISSPALDFSPPIAGNDLGIDGRPRDQQVRPGPPRALVRDVGALERQPPDPYLINGTFDSSLRLWINNFPEYTRWSPQGDGSGSTEMFIPGDQTGEPGGIQVVSIHGVTQCFAVPWPGAYELTARGLSRVDGSVAFPDTATVNWRLRFSSPNCTGPADVEGDLFLPTNIGWNSPIAPSRIVIPASSWNFQTTLEISPGVLQNFNDPAIQNPIFARLDNVVLRYEDDGDVIFRNGFDGET